MWLPSSQIELLITILVKSKAVESILSKTGFTECDEVFIVRIRRRDGRVVDCTGLENRHRFVAYLGFKSLSLRHIKESRCENSGFFVFVALHWGA